MDRQRVSLASCASPTSHSFEQPLSAIFLSRNCSEELESSAALSSSSATGACAGACEEELACSPFLACFRAMAFAHLFAHFLPLEVLEPLLCGLPVAPLSGWLPNLTRGLAPRVQLNLAIGLVIEFLLRPVVPNLNFLWVR
jgi:hypothetical protein